MNPITSSATRLTLLILICGLVYMSINNIDVNETYKSILLMVVSFYFGQKITTK